MEQVCLEHCRILASHNTPTQSLGQPQPSFPTPHARAHTHTRCPRRMVLPPCENHHYVLTHSRQLIKERCCSLHLCRFALLQECTQANSDSHQWPQQNLPSTQHGKGPGTLATWNRAVIANLNAWSPLWGPQLTQGAPPRHALLEAQNQTAFSQARPFRFLAPVWAHLFWFVANRNLWFRFHSVI